MSERDELHKMERCLLWLGMCLLFTAAVAWIAFQIQQEQISPAILFPLVVGAVLGAGNLTASRYAQVTSGRWLLLAAILWGLLAVVGQDYIGHRHRLQSYQAEMSRQSPWVAMAAAEQPELRPSFGEYLAGVIRARPAWWGLDVMITSGAALAVTSWGLRRDRHKPCSA